MKYISTKNPNEKVSFKEAVENGLCPEGGLYIPEQIHELKPVLFERIDTLKRCDLAFEVLYPFIKGDIPKKELKNIIKDSLNFPTPLVQIEKNTWVLELFHGPTEAFKDVGARFMSRCLSYFSQENNQEINILVATSGDTGSAVAQGFYQVANTKVKILFPKEKVSLYQQHQMTSLGKNIQAIEVDGSFDDCQALVKRAFLDDELKKSIKLSSANSINIARLLPQMLYYFYAYQQLSIENRSKKIIISVPSGNLGNLTAGILAKKMGLPIQLFVAAQNRNNTFEEYQKTGEYNPKPSVLTYSNAMDVGAPSNFERLQHFYSEDYLTMKKDVVSAQFSDEETILAIKKCKSETNYTLDPHGAVAKLGLEKYLQSNDVGILLETASPKKFEEVMKKAIHQFESPTIDHKNEIKKSIPNNYSSLKELLLK